MSARGTGKYDGAAYLMVPHDVWNNLVVFSDMVGADVHVVMIRALQDHIKMHSSGWSEEQKQKYSKRLKEMVAERKRAFNGNA